MKQRHKVHAGRNARLVLAMAGVKQGDCFSSLPAHKVAKLLTEAHRVRYQPPPYAKGQAARCYHDMLQRLAKL